jgi:uncharacterized protein YecE (DUF72 family)
MAMDWRVGTMGFSYADWAGVFYPRGTKPSDYLAHYAKYFDTVELDTTFHATPPPQRFRRWAEVTPDGFRFAAKMPKAVTHEVAPDRAIGAMNEFLDSARNLGDKLGVVLIQFAPQFEINQFDSVARLLAVLPTDLRFAVEFRNRTWGTQRTLDLLRQHRCALVAAEYLSRTGRIHVTTDFLYVRLIGEHERFEELDHEQRDVSESLNWWDREVAHVANQVKTAWCFFNNDFSGYSVATANRFKSLTGQVVHEPPAIPGGLFG